MKIVNVSKVQRKVWGLTIPMFLLVLLGSSIVIAGATILMLRLDISLSNAGVMVSDMPTSLSGTAGSLYEYSVNVSNLANQNTNYTLTLTLSETSLIDGEAEIRIKDNESSLLCSDNTVTNDNITCTTNDLQINVSKSIFDYEIIIEFNSSSTNTSYDLDLILNAGTFDFKD